MNGDFGGCRGGGGTDCHSQCVHWLRNDTLQGVGRRADVGIGPYGGLQGGAMGGRPQGSPLRRVTGGAVCGPSGTPAPTKAYLVVRRGGALPLPRATARVAPTEGYRGCNGRATARVAPTEGLHGVRYKIGGRGRTPPLRRVTRSDCVRGRAAALHQGSFLQRSSVLWTTWATLWPRPG